MGKLSNNSQFSIFNFMTLVTINNDLTRNSKRTRKTTAAHAIKQQQQQKPKKKKNAMT